MIGGRFTVCRSAAGRRWYAAQELNGRKVRHRRTLKMRRQERLLASAAAAEMAAAAAAAAAAAPATLNHRVGRSQQSVDASRQKQNGYSRIR